jgi:hypothetical protein
MRVSNYFHLCHPTVCQKKYGSCLTVGQQKILQAHTLLYVLGSGGAPRHQVPLVKPANEKLAHLDPAHTASQPQPFYSSCEKKSGHARPEEVPLPLVSQDAPPSAPPQVPHRHRHRSPATYLLFSPSPARLLAPSLSAHSSPLSLSHPARVLLSPLSS